MPIGAIIGAAASIGGGLLASKATKSAAKDASATASQTADKNNALTREIYNQNTANMTPFMQSGQQAMGVLNGLLYGQQTQQLAQQPPPAQIPAQPGNALLGSGEYWNDMHLGPGGIGNGVAAAVGYNQGQFPAQLPAQLPAQTQQVGQPQPAPQGQNAWDQFRNSTNYQFRLGEGLNALNQGYAARGAFQSGAAMKGINNYAQQFASNELGSYMNMLANQQNMGMAGASALTGVGQNMVNNVTANNNAAGSAAANAALMAGQANANMWGGIGGALGSLAGSFGSSFRW